MPLDNTWLITESAFRNYLATIQHHAKMAISIKIDQGPTTEMQIDNGVAVIPVEGLIMKSLPEMFFMVEPITTIDDMKAAFDRAMADSDVKSIVLDINSPGGTSAGLFKFAKHIKASRGTKPIIAYTSTTMASAAYAIGAMADSVYVGDNMTDVGSIGVYRIHEDLSEFFKKLGVNYTLIKAGSEKAIGHPTQSLTDADKEVIQRDVNEMYSDFAQLIADARELELESSDEWANGKLFSGNRAIELGLIDGIKPRDQVISEMINPAASMGNQTEVTSMADAPGKEPKLTADSLKASSPDVYKAVYDAGFSQAKAEFDTALKAGIEQAIETERKRTEAILSLKGPSEILMAGIADGSDAGAVAIALNKAETSTMKAHLEATRTQSPEPVADEPKPSGKATESPDDALKAEYAKLTATEVKLYDSLAAKSGKAGITGFDVWKTGGES